MQQGLTLFQAMNACAIDLTGDKVGVTFDPDRDAGGASRPCGWAARSGRLLISSACGGQR
jgi:hypothetical protein